MNDHPGIGRLMPRTPPPRPTIGHFRHWLEGVSYKPGWTIEVEPFFDTERFGPTNVGDVAKLTVTAVVMDARDPNTDAGMRRRRQIKVSMSKVTHTAAFLNKAGFLDWVYGVVLELERHESGEWWVVDGKRPHDPHDPRRNVT